VSIAGGGRGGRAELTIVFAYRRTNTYGPHVVLGALEVLPPPGPVDVKFAIGVPALVAAVRDAVAGSPAVLVAWSFYSPDFPRSTKELAAVRAATADAGPEVDIVHLAGGPHASAEPLATLTAGWDAVAIGEGETTFARTVAALVERRSLASVPGLGFLDDGRLVTTGPAVRGELDHFPAFAHAWGRYNAIELTRGCIYACAFCQTPFLFKARFRHRSVANVVEHVAICRSVGRRDIRFVTPTSLSYGSTDESVHLEAIDELLAACRRAAGPDGRVFFGSFPSEVRPEHVTPEALRVLKRHVANDNLVIGAQSGSDAVLAASNRGHDVASVERAVRVALAEGFRPNVDLLFGLPSEGEAEAAASVALARRLADLGARVHSHTFMPLPGTPLRAAPPGRVSPLTAAALDDLAGRGRQYGQFRRQQQVAEELVRFVRRPDRR
jgi:B12-binding domain/radical SAM domain protein